jgi:DNA-binding transcriptional LysR family regulator
MFDLYDIRAFVAVEEHGTFTAAAAAIYTTQPSLSRRIARLEHEVGGLLFDRRNRRSPRLAPLGRALLPYARQLLSDEVRLNEVARIQSQGTRGWVTLALSDITAELALPTMYRYVAQRFSGLHLDLVQRSAGPGVREALTDQLAELAFLEHSYVLPEFECFTFGVTQHVALGRPRFLGNTDDPIEWEELRRLPLLLPVAVEDMLYSAPGREPPRVIHQAAAPGVLRTMACAEMGVMILGGVRRHGELVCRPIAMDGVLQKSMIDVAWPSPAVLGPAARRLVDDLAERLRGREPVQLEEGVAASLI